MLRSRIHVPRSETCFIVLCKMHSSIPRFCIFVCTILIQGWTMMSPDNELPAWVRISLILYSPMLSVCDRARLFGAILSPFIHYRFRATCGGFTSFAYYFVALSTFVVVKRLATNVLLRNVWQLFWSCKSCKTTFYLHFNFDKTNPPSGQKDQSFYQ